MKIKACETLGPDLSDPDVTKTLVERIPACPGGAMEIDFTGCIIDYEATSAILDAALARVEAATTARELVAVFNIKFQEHVFLKWFFLGSVRLGLVGKTASDEEIRVALSRELKRLNMKFRIKIIEPGNPIQLACYDYD